MTTVGAFSRFVSVLHALPLWILAGLALAGYGALFLPGFAGVDVTEFRKTLGPWLWLDAIGFSALAGTCAIDLIFRRVARRCRLRAKLLKTRTSNRYFRVYAPDRKSVV